MARKSISTSALSTSILQAGSASMRRKLMNDIMYYLRRLIKMGRSLQTLQIRESVEDTSIQEQFEQLAKEVDELEESIK
jgi:hypothetical protein